MRLLYSERSLRTVCGKHVSLAAAAVPSCRSPATGASKGQCAAVRRTPEEEPLWLPPLPQREWSLLETWAGGLLPHDRIGRVVLKR